MIEKEVVIGLETGMLLLHKHGNDCMLVSSISLSFKVTSGLTTRQHEGREVLEGEKWVVRTDLCVRRESTRSIGRKK